MSFLRFIFRLPAFLIAAFVVLPITIILILTTQKINNRKWNKKVVNAWSKIICRACGIRIQSKGVKHGNPVLIVANHISWLDIPIIHSQKLLGFIAKSEIGSWPLFGLLIKSGEVVLIKRGKHKSRKKVLELMQQRLKQKRSIGVFPEGKATNGEKLGRFHRQLLQAAIETQVPIQAVAIKFIHKDGTRNKNIGFRPHEKFIPNILRILALPSSTAELNFCEPLETKDITARDAALKTQQQVAEKLAENDYM